MARRKIEMIFLTALVALLALLPVRYSDCASTASASPASEEECGVVCRNLKQDWNYLFHPERINQCKPREIEVPNNRHTSA